MSKQPKVSLAKNKGRRSLDGVDGFTTSIGAGSVFTGTISGEGHTIVLGHIEGNSELSGTVVVGEGGKWVGDLTADTVVIAGFMEGCIVAREKIEILSTAKMRGSLTSPVIAIAEGAVHDGSVRMGEVKRFTDQREET
ncbi:MAG: polymer-forming cytoskeletal protein [Ectothiorhodospiraceae bacterium]|nr:polymer-forming cytoskeletal protein [Ectothiorhodospiraceae bacterium]